MPPSQALQSKAPVILVTGGSGFIGSALVRHILDETDCSVINLDALTYAASPRTLNAYRNHPRYVFEHKNICDKDSIKALLSHHKPDGIIHLAAESHVDRSIDNPLSFVWTNVVGTCNLLDEAHSYWKKLDGGKRDNFRFLHVSTDEVYGSLGETGVFTEESAYAPNSPYAASKASSDHFIRAWHHTHGLPVLISNCSNNFGPYQFPEKLIPLMIIKALRGEPLPVYGKGLNVRDWLYVEDHADALWAIYSKGKIGTSYNVGGNNEFTNIEIVRRLCSLLDEYAPAANDRPYSDLITYVADRPGHDLRYAIDSTRLCRDLDWQPKQDFEEGLRKTVRWYLDNRSWWQEILDNNYAGARLGLA